MVPGTGPQVTGFTDAVAVVPGQSPAAAFAPVLGQLLLFKEFGDALGDDPFLLPDRRQFVVVAEAFEVVVEQGFAQSGTPSPDFFEGENW